MRTGIKVLAIMLALGALLQALFINTSQAGGGNDPTAKNLSGTQEKAKTVGQKDTGSDRNDGVADTGSPLKEIIRSLRESAAPGAREIVEPGP